MKKTATSVIISIIRLITWFYSLHIISGLKFKLVKSNSCSSRLELAGTGLDEKQLRDNQTIMESIQNRSLSPLPDAEESVRTLVSRLEIGAINHKSMPRIIESKCIEKMTDSIKTPEQQEQNALTVNNHSPIKDEPRLRPVDILTQVTVNNHISYSSPAQLNLHVTSVQPLPSPSTTENNRLNKVGRNRNVDLAFNSMNKSVSTSSLQSEVAPPSAKSIITPAKATTTSKTILTTTAPKAMERENQHASLINSAVSTTYLKNAKNLLNHNNDAAATTQPPTMVSTRRDSGNNNSNITNHHNNSHRNDTIDNIDAAENPVGPRLVKWNTLSKFDEKNYVTNDVKLKQKPKYDDIEFEEFEVFDPNNPPNTECYDSLNDK